MRRRHVGRWAFPLVALAAVATAAVTVPAVAGPRPAPTAEVSAPSYVALGDSYAAGPAIPEQTGEPAGCRRSTENYPAAVASILGLTDVRDVTCSAASTEDLTAAQPVQSGVNAPQLDALSSDTDIVTLTIGGNDIGFTSIVTDCATRSPSRPLGAACRAFYTTDGTDQLAERIEDTAPKIAEALDEIKNRAPHARVLLVGYPAILPDSGPGCFPAVPFSPGDVAYLRETEKRLNDMLADEAEDADVDYIDTYAPFDGHDVCQLPGTRWIEGLIPTAPAAAMHPNALGMSAMATAVIEALATRDVPVVDI